jgi:hypothetical protein
LSGLEIIGLLGTGLSAVGSIVAGSQQAAMAEAQAAAAERQASEERAASQREAIQRSKEARLVMSRQQAVAAASGGGATDSTVLNLMGDTASQGWFNQASAVYEGESRGRALEDQAAISRWEGKQAKMASFISAGSTVLSGISGLSGTQRGFKKRKMPTMTPTYRYF